MVIPAAGRAYNIPSARDPKRWNLSIFLGNQPWGPTWLCILFFSLKVGYFDIVKNILKQYQNDQSLISKRSTVAFLCYFFQFSGAIFQVFLSNQGVSINCGREGSNKSVGGITKFHYPYNIVACTIFQAPPCQTYWSSPLGQVILTYIRSTRSAICEFSVGSLKILRASMGRCLRLRVQPYMTLSFQACRNNQSLKGAVVVALCQNEAEVKCQMDIYQYISPDEIWWSISIGNFTSASFWQRVTTSAPFLNT